MDLLLLAMMADASDEELSLLRQFDKSYLPTSDVRSLVQTFITKIEFLFLRSGATETGFTQYVGTLVCLEKSCMLIINQSTTETNFRFRRTSNS